ncbi:hypothetical protein CL631_02895 [bacterium]|jgi:O-antigen ligase/tetratricopeptide (TPR) repeat protein|nr:hypothetical protein [bacterium]MDP6659720.1 tetratricopeptide repeat protein [Candidatus Paceibacterota bacterium]|tara:strand:- start:5138 stop:7315 length:2178 start_codon:yes stop_codon:yes gene_type:complete
MSISVFLRKALIFGVFLVPFIPLLITNSMYFPFITGKNFFFRILVEILLAGWVILALWDPQYRPRFTWLLGSIAAFISIISLADAFGENPLNSFWSNFERMEGLVAILHLGAYFLVAGALLNTKELWGKFLNTSIGVSAIIGIYGLFQLGGALTINQGGVRLDGTLGNAGYLAIYMLFHIFLTFLMLTHSFKQKWIRYVYGAIILLQVVILYHTATRGAILGLVGGVFLALLLFGLFSKNRPGIRRGVIVAIVSLAIATGGFFLAKDTSFVRSSPVLSRIASISISELAPRLAIWNMGYQAFKEHPILGWGQENFIFAFNKYYDPAIYNQEPWFDRVHNIFFDWLVAGGILGLLAYLSLYFVSLYYLWFGGRSVFSTAEKSIFTGLFAGYFFHNLLVFDNIISYVLFFSILAYIHHRIVISSERSGEPKVFNVGVVNRLYVPAVAVVLVGSLYFFNMPGILQAKSLIKAITPQQGGLTENLEVFRKALSYDTFGNQEIREQLMRGATSLAARQDIPIEEKQALFALTVEEYKKMIEAEPEDARHYLFLATVYRVYGQYDLALESLLRAVELSPKKQPILFEIGLNFLSKDDTARAAETFRQAFELETEYGEARILYAVALIYDGRLNVADELLLEAYDTAIIPNSNIAQAYFDIGLKDRAIASLEAAVEEKPSNLQFRTSLSAAYLDVGRRTDAIEQLRKTIELNPSFKEQGEFYIQEIEAGRNP